jgi:uncharacterized tellurite resistance protein B-like protein
MNPDLVTSPEQAVTHLFFHCCYKDGAVTENEIKAVSEKLVVTGLNKELNFHDEIVQYKTYRKSLTDEAAYLENLVARIQPANELALYSYCVELCLSDGLLQAEEELLLKKIATALQLNAAEESACNKLLIQRRVVEMEKVF